MSLLKRRTRSSKDRAVTVYDRQGANDGVQGDLYVNGRRREVAMYRPPVVLDGAGNSLPGVDRQLVANYLVATTGMLADVDLGPVRVDWQARVGRFASASMNMETWGQSLSIMMPVHVISQDLEVIMQMYQEAICLKAQEIHRGHQDYTRPNAILARAAKQLEKLRDSTHPHFTDAEYLFVSGQLAGARVMNALVPLPVDDGEQVIGQTARVQPRDGRLPSGG